MSESEPSGLPPSSMGIGVGLPPLTLPPLSLPPIKTEQLGLSPLGMASYPSPGLSHSMMSSPMMSSGVPSPSSHHTNLNNMSSMFSHNQNHNSGLTQHSAFGSSASQMHHAQKRRHLQTGTMAAVQNHLQRQDQPQAQDFRQIKSVPVSPSNSFSNPSTPSSVPMMRYNSSEMAPSPSSSNHDPSPRPSPCPSPLVPNGHGAPPITNNGSQPSHNSHAFQRPPPSYQPPLSDEPSGSGGTVPNGVHSAPTTDGPSTSMAQHHRPRSAAAGTSNEVTHSSQAIVQHLPLKSSPYHNGPLSGNSSAQGGQQSSSQAVIQHLPIPPAPTRTNQHSQLNFPGNMAAPASGSGNCQPKPDASDDSTSPSPHLEAKDARQNLIGSSKPGPPKQSLLEQRLTKPVESSGGVEKQQRIAPPTASTTPTKSPAVSASPSPSPSVSSQEPSQPNLSLSQHQVAQILLQRATANGNSPSPALQQVLASRSLAQQQRLQQLQAQGIQPPHVSGQVLPGRHQLPHPVALHPQQLGRLPVPLSGMPGLPPPPSAALIRQQQQQQQQQQSAAAQLAQLIDERQAPLSSNKEQYRLYKRKFKYLVFENECYQEELRNLQRKLLKLSRDKNFLLDRLMQFEKVSDSSDDDSDASQKTVDERPKARKRVRQRKRAAATNSPLSSRGGGGPGDGGSMSGTPSPSPSPAPAAVAATHSQGSSGNLLAQMLLPSTSGQNFNSSEPFLPRLQHPNAVKPAESKRQRLMHDSSPGKRNSERAASSAPSSGLLQMLLPEDSPSTSTAASSNGRSSVTPVPVSGSSPRQQDDNALSNQASDLAPPVPNPFAHMNGQPLPCSSEIPPSGSTNSSPSPSSTRDNGTSSLTVAHKSESSPRNTASPADEVTSYTS